MSDIVKVLRGKHALDYDEKTLDQFCNEAADEIEKLRAALIMARIAVSHACDLSDRILYTQDLARINAALGEKQ